MDLQYRVAACRLVQAVDVLSDEREPRRALLQSNESEMPGVGLGRLNKSPTPVVPLPNEFRITRKGFGGGEILRPELLPQP